MKHPLRDSGGIVKEEEYDFGGDLRLARRWKRRCIASENFRLNNCRNKASKETVSRSNKNNAALAEVVTVDSDYEEFLNDTVQHVDVHSDAWCVDDVNDDDHNGEVLDPHYKMFLDNIKEDEKSYVLEIALSNETSVVIRYEEDNGSSDGLDVENLEDCQSTENTETENSLSQLDREKIKNTRRVFGSDSEREKVEAARKVSKINSMRQKAVSRRTVLRSNSCWRKTKSTSEILRSTCRREDNRSPSVLNDVIKRGKTENPRILRSNASREENGSPSILNDRVKREETESPRTLRINSRRVNDKASSILHGVGSRENAENPRSLQNVSRREGMGTRKRLRYVQIINKTSPKLEKKIKMEAKDFVSANGCSSKRHSLDVDVQYKCNFGMNSSFVDESYLEFLDSLEKNCQEGSKMEYDKDEDSTSDLIILDRDPFLVENLTPFESSKSYASCVVIDGVGYTESPCGSKKSQFREKLMEKLQKRFDMTEYEALWRDALCQRPKKGTRELRNRTVSFSVDSVNNCKSYLDLHESLAKKIDEAQHDQRQVLNLLRGFFYWLENVSHGGSFTPWSDAKCLSTLPPV